MDKCISAISPLVKKYYDQLASQASDAENEILLSAPAFDEHEAMRAISTILGGWISQGKNVKEFEESAALHFGTASGIGPFVYTLF